MPRKKHKPEEIVAKLRQVDVAVAQGVVLAEGWRAREPGWSGRSPRPSLKRFGRHNAARSPRHPATAGSGLA